MGKFLDENGLLYFWQKIVNKFVAKESGKGLSSNDFTSAEKEKLAGIAEGANKYILPTASAETLGGVKVGMGLSVSPEGVLSATGGGEADAVSWENVAGKPTTIAGYGITDAYTKSEIDGKVSSVYKPGGALNFADLPEPSASNLGYVYSVNDAFTTDDRFLASEPVEYPIGTNVVVVSVLVEGLPQYKFDVLAGFVDLSEFMKKTDVVAITNQEIDTIVSG